MTLPPFEHILYEKKGRIAYVTINRPQVMNALHPPAHAELTRAWDDFIADDQVWVAILTAAGERAFSAGTDLKYRVEQTDDDQLRNPVHSPVHILDRCYKPIIAAVNGYAIGGGLELALHCDLIVAAASARFGFPEARRGLLADAGGVLKLPRRIPYHLAMGMLLTGKLFSAREALAMGLVNEVADDEPVMATAERWAAEILACGPLAVQAAKQVALHTIESPISQAQCQLEDLTAVRRLRLSEDYAEGPRAFAEKRKPQWKGK
jgi:enoyl-CoA hydratase/carnithine racemase